MKHLLYFIAAMSGANAAHADVSASSDAGFVIEHRVTVRASAAVVSDLIARPSRWWNPAHSWSGSATNMTLDARAGGCFCERLAGGGSVEHGRVIFAQRGKQLRLLASLGPLQGEAVTATLTFALQSDGANTIVVVTYVVGGYARGGLKRFAGPVDGVVGEQVTRLADVLKR